MKPHTIAQLVDRERRREAKAARQRNDEGLLFDVRKALETTRDAAARARVERALREINVVYIGRGEECQQ
jgi:hypothetical protein